MKKNKSQNNKAQRNSSFFIGLLIISLFIILVGVSYMYLKSERDKIKFKEDFADVITSIQELNISSKNMVNGSVNIGLNDIKSTISKFDMFSNGYFKDIKKLTAEQQQLSATITTDWAELKSNLNTLVSFESLIRAISKARKTINSSKGEVGKLTKDIISKLDVFQDTHNLKVALSSLGQNTNKLSSLLNGLSQTGNSLKSTDVAKEIQAYIKSSNGVISESRKLGSVAFVAGDREGAKKMDDLLNNHIKVISPLVSLLPKEIKEISNLKLIVANQREIIPLINAKLTDFSSKKDAKVVGPIPNIPVGYPPIILFLLIAIVLLSAAWVFLKNKISNALRKEAEKLRDEAEKRDDETKNSINRLMLVLEELSDGDLTVEAEVSADSTGSVADYINNVVESMREMVGTIVDTSNRVTEITDKTADISGFLADSSLEQSKKINASREITENMATSLAGVANYTELSVEIARSSFDIANKGRALVQSTIKGMNGIRENIQDTSKRIKHLGESSQEISDIVEMIKSIADQTNILALNAAIQATSAGEAGKGFAVVADEVQRLAERSTNATKKIDSLVKTIQLDVNEAGASMEESIKEVVLGSEVAEKAGGSLDKIEEASKNMASLIVNISNVIKAESETAVQVSNDMEDITALNKKTVDDVISSVNSVKVLQKLAVTLKDSISDFTLPDEDEDDLI